MCVCLWSGPAPASLWPAWDKPLTPALCSAARTYLVPLTDTAAKLQAVKEKARQANDTAKDVLAQIKDLHQNLDGLKKNYNQLADSVAKTNAVVKDPLKNSKICFFTLIVSFVSFHSRSSLDPTSWWWRRAHTKSAFLPGQAQEVSGLSSTAGIQVPSALVLSSFTFCSIKRKLGIPEVCMTFGIGMPNTFFFCQVLF